jgi:hypothetical protein
MSLIPHPTLEQRRGDVLTSAPAVEPVTAAELRAHLVGVADSDASLLVMITAAREDIESATGMALITQSWTITVDRWPSASEPWWDGVRQMSISALSGAPGWLRLSRWPLQSVESVTTYNEAGAATAVSVATVFDVDTAQTPGRLALKSGQTWPVALRPTNAIVVGYTSGYGDAGADVPGPIKRAIMQLAAYAYSHRGDDCDLGDAYFASGAAAIMARYKVARI